MPTLEVHMKPQGAVLTRYMNSRARVSFIMGPLGSGKTFQSCQKIFDFMCEQRPNADGVRKSRWVAVRNTYPDLSGTTIKDWRELFDDPSAPSLGQYKGNGSEPPTHYLDFDLDDGTTVRSELVFLALDREDHVKKLRGMQVTGFWLNEIKELTKTVVDMCDLRHGRYPSAMDGGPSWHGMIGDTNAPDDDHWYYKLSEEVMPDGWVFYQQPGGVVRAGVTQDGRIIWDPNRNAENLNNLPDGYYVKGMAGKSDDWIAVNLANEYGSVVSGKAIYPEFSERVHVAPEKLQPYKGINLVLGWDFGLTPAVIIGQVSLRGQMRILDELIAEDMGIRRFARDVVKPFLAVNYAGFEISSHGDPAGVQRAQTNEKTCFQELEGQNLFTEPARTNDFTARRESIAGYLNTMVDGKPGFLISPHCKVLITGFRGGYQYRRLLVAGDARYTEKPDKNKFSHPHDALQYLGLAVEKPPTAKNDYVVKRKKKRRNV